jgi:UDP-N-acetylglucosamine 2-epimerase (non-hydrolysing)
VLLTAHRRESWGPPMEQVALGVADAARARPDALIVWPLHPNPAIDQAVRPAVRGLANVRLVRPAGYCEFVDLVRRADVIVTDSGGVQEEGAYLGKRLLVLRDVTERPEAVDAGIATLVGTDRSAVADAIVRAVASERGGPSYRSGDGCAGSRAVAAVAHYFGDGPRPADVVSGVYPALSPV